jgi:acyl-CoA synthetase (AMP-forming)/AMP-acid ligase II
VPLNPSIEESNLAYIIKVCGAKIAFVAPALANRNREFPGTVIGDYSDLQANNGNLELNAMDQEGFDPERLAEVIFTSGSTGEPKGVMIRTGISWPTPSRSSNTSGSVTISSRSSFLSITATGLLLHP